MKPYSTCMLWIIIQSYVLLLSHLIFCLYSFNKVEHCPMKMGKEAEEGGGGSRMVRK